MSVTTKAWSGLIVNEALEIVEFLGGTSAYIRFPPGNPTLALRRLLRPALHAEVFAAIKKAAKAGRAETKEFTADAEPRRVKIEVHREGSSTTGLRYRILFKEASHPSPPQAAISANSNQEPSQESEIDKLRRELAETRETFAAILQEEERYRSAARDRQAADEELQELAAKLETTNTELEATSEELRAALAVSEELKIQSEERFARFMENLPGLAWIKDLEGRYVYANEAAERAFRTPRATLYGKNDTDLFPPETAKQFQENDQGALARGEGLQVIETLEHEDGTHHSIVSKFPIRDTDGKAVMVGGVAIDITEQRNAENALRRSEKELSDFFENASVGLHWVGADGTILRANQAELNMLGYRREEYVGRSITEFHADQTVIHDILARLSRGETLQDYPARVRCKDGSIRDVLIDSNALFEDGKFIHSRCFTRDVSDLKRAQQAQALLAAIVESSDDAIVGKSMEGIIQSWNASAERVFGYPAEEAVGRPITLIIPPDRLSEEEEIMRRLHAGQPIDHFESVRLRKDGRLVPVSLTISPIKDESGRVIGASKIARDITARRQSEQALRESEQRLRLALAAGQMGTWEWSLETNKVVWSPSLEAIHGLQPGSFAGTFEAYAEDIHPDDRDKVRNSITRALESGSDHHLEYRIIWPDGSLHWVEARGKVFRNDAAVPVRMTGVCIDVTDRKQAEEALRESEARFRTLADSSPVLIWVNGLEGCEFVNRAYLDFLGVKPTDVRRYDWAQFVHPDNREEYLNSYLEAFSRREFFTGQFRFRRADGEYRWMKTVGVPRFSGTGQFQGYTGSTVDITDIKEAEVALRESEEALREADRRKDDFLAMLGHELRNPLAAISSGAALLGTDPVPDRRAWIEQMITRQTRQLQRLVDDLLDVSRISHGKIDLRKETVSLQKLLQTAVAAVEDLMTQQHHRFSLSVPSEEIFLEADPARLEQMLVNLLANAAKYTPEGGSVWLSAERTGHEVIIRCRDTGIGLSPKDLDEIFEPFVQLGAERPSGVGLGIGLSLVKRLSEMHGGSVAASSAGPGKGSEFTLRLPVLAADAPAASLAVETPSPPAPAKESRRILLVDDNQDLADSVALLLRDAGHEVLIAHDGEAAIAMASQQPLDIVLLDIGLPDMNGCAVAERLRRDPNLKDTTIVAISGYGSQTGEKAGAAFDAHLVKPVAPEMLMEILEERAPGRRSASEKPDSRRILLIEDNKDLALLTADLLRQNGQDVRIALDGEQGFEEARRFQPQIVVCDLRLPGMDGFEVARRVRREFSRDVPILVGMTADVTGPLQQQVSQTPFDAFLSKPLLWRQFRECIELLLKGGASR